jgi:hypothetical protein
VIKNRVLGANIKSKPIGEKTRGIASLRIRDSEPHDTKYIVEKT